MKKFEGPQVMAAILTLAVIALAVVFATPTYIKEVIPSVVTGIGMLGMKLLEDHSDKP